jgi:hypothetical protein
MSSFSNYAHWKNNQSYDYESVAKKNNETFVNTPSCGCSKKNTNSNLESQTQSNPLEGYSNLNTELELSNETKENKETEATHNNGNLQNQNNNLNIENFSNNLANIKWVCTYGPNINKMNNSEPENTWSCNPSEQ